jgi:hypothetical protein
MKKTIDITDFFISMARIEALLEESLFRQILQSKNGDVEKTNETFKTAMKNIDTSTKERLGGLRDPK